MIKILGLALYGPVAASTRYRLGQFVPGLASFGIDLRVRSLLGDDYLQQQYHGGRFPISALVRDAAARLRQLKDDPYDAVMLYCELFPFMPAWLERMLIRGSYIYDMDDAFYLRYQLGRKRVLKPILGRKIETVIGGAAAVTAGNRTLASYASRFNKNVAELPTVVDTHRYVPKSGMKRQNFTVGWIGSPSTATYLPQLAEPLSALGAEAPIDFIVIGGKAPNIPNVNVIEYPWSEETEIDLINTFDVGLMPLPDDDWARGKCAFKLIQYMACGVPVVASAVGTNNRVVTPECGYLVGRTSDWVNAIRTLRQDHALRRAMGDASRERVVQEFSLHTALPRLSHLIHQVAAA